MNTMLVAVAALAISGCGKSAPVAETKAEVQATPGRLTKEQATALIRAKWDATAPCEWKEFVTRSGTGDAEELHLTSRSETDTPKVLKCLTALVSAGILTTGECAEPSRYGCKRFKIVLGKGKLSTDNRVHFVCGSRALDEVTSTTTEDRKATAKFDRTLKVDADLVKSLEACTIDAPAPGRAEREEKFSRDDDGKWAAAR